MGTVGSNPTVSATRSSAAQNAPIREDASPGRPASSSGPSSRERHRLPAASVKRISIMAYLLVLVEGRTGRPCSWI
jgi:hypothetical protein